VGGTRVLAETQRLGRHRHVQKERPVSVRRSFRRKLMAIVAAVGLALGIVVVFAVRIEERAGGAGSAGEQRLPVDLPIVPASYIGVYPGGVPYSYSGVTAFTNATGVKPRVVLYYSGWAEPFQTSFVRKVAHNGAVPLVQIDPDSTSVAAIASGWYDAYLRSYADAVRAYGHPVILSFGHEMNGYWYPWGYLHTRAAVFVAAWRHIVTLFRADGARNVTWMWTINTVHARANVPSPKPWWPGASYVNWVGIDGYYFTSSNMFASVFGPTIAAVRALTHDPILIGETAALPGASQAAQVSDLFAGVHLYGLLGFVWFDAVHTQDWRLSGSAAIAAFRRGAEEYRKSAS
jgi:mannan endo-1,4-beta-mannosidase